MIAIKYFFQYLRAAFHPAFVTRRYNWHRNIPFSTLPAVNPPDFCKPRIAPSDTPKAPPIHDDVVEAEDKVMDFAVSSKYRQVDE